jgi:tetratricopeptide (TPR) repeat protein
MATRVRGEQSSELMDLRMDCLGRDLAALRALVDQLAAPQPKTVERAIQATASLPPLGDCANVVTLRAPVRPPDDVAVRRRIEDTRGDLARAVALMDTAHGPDAIKLAEGAVDSSRAIGYRPLEAEALETLGRLLDASQQGRRALEPLRDAVYAAVAGRHEVVEVEASIELVYAAIIDHRYADARDFARRAHVVLERTPDADRLAKLVAIEGLGAWQEGRLEEARPTLEQALSMRRAISPPDDPELGRIFMFLSNVLSQQARYDDALAASRSAVEIREKALGPEHPFVASSLVTVGNALLGKGDAAGAEEAYRRALDIKIAALGPENPGVCDAMDDIGIALWHQRKLDAALEILQRAVAIEERTVGPDDDETCHTIVNVNDVLLEMKRWEDVIPLALRALAGLEKSRGSQSWILAYPLTQLGRAHLGAGRALAALPHLERAAALVDSRDVDPVVAAETRAALALALRAARREPARAASLAARARKLLKDPIVSPELAAQVDAAFPP